MPIIETENLISTLDQFNTAVFLKDVSGRYFSMNRAGVRLVNKLSHEVLGKTAHDLFDFKSASQMQESDHYTMNSKSIYTATYNTTELSSGKPMHLFSAKIPILSPSGRALGTIGMSLVNYKNSDLFAHTCKILPHFIKQKCSNLITELIETRTITDFFKIHHFQ